MNTTLLIFTTTLSKIIIFTTTLSKIVIIAEENVLRRLRVKRDVQLMNDQLMFES